MRQDYKKFLDLNTEIVVIGPENASEFKNYWLKETLQFIGLPDPKHLVSKLYGQEVKLLKLGRLPAVLFVDKNGIIRFLHYANSMYDIPKNKEILTQIIEVNQNENFLE